MTRGKIILASHPRDDTPSHFSRLRRHDDSHHVVTIKASRKKKLERTTDKGRDVSWLSRE